MLRLTPLERDRPLAKAKKGRAPTNRRGDAQPEVHFASCLLLVGRFLSLRCSGREPAASIAPGDTPFEAARSYND